MPPKSPKGPKGKPGAKVEEKSPADNISFSDIKVELKPHYSAPSYLNSLAENDLPPFKQPTKEPRPKLLCGPNPLVSEEDMVEMVAASDEDPVNGMRKYLGHFLVKKELINNYDITERNFLISFLLETVDYAAQRDYDALKLSMIFNIYLTTHLYFKWYYWSSPVAIWNYFQELMIRHTIQASPDSETFFDPLESYDIITHFHTMYISNLPLIHIITFGAHRLRLNWPFKVEKGK